MKDTCWKCCVMREDHFSTLDFHFLFVLANPDLNHPLDYSSVVACIKLIFDAFQQFQFINLFRKCYFEKTLPQR